MNRTRSESAELLFRRSLMLQDAGLLVDIKLLRAGLSDKYLREGMNVSKTRVGNSSEQFETERRTLKVRLLQFWFAAISLSLAGCGSYWETQTHGTTVGGVPLLVATADQRMIVARNQGDKFILCSEPSPDTAKALQTAFAMSGSGQAPGGPEASASFNATTAEAITQLAGRTAGVVALRDGAFRTCEFYANGAIGKTEVALALSRYGDLLSALMLAEAARSVSTGSGDPAAAIAKIADDYFNEERLFGSLIVACASANDETSPTKNNLLTLDNCNGYIKNFENVAVLRAQTERLVELEKAKPTPAKPAVSPPKPKVDATVQKAQKVLAAAKDYTGKIDGILGPETKKAIVAYQKANGVAPTGALDAKTKTAMGIGT